MTKIKFIIAVLLVVLPSLVLARRVVMKTRHGSFIVDTSRLFEIIETPDGSMAWVEYGRVLSIRSNPYESPGWTEYYTIEGSLASIVWTNGDIIRFNEGGFPYMHKKGGASTVCPFGELPYGGCRKTKSTD